MSYSRNYESPLSVLVYLIAFVLVYVVAIVIAAMVPEDRAVRTMEAQAFDKVLVVEKNIFFIGWRGCSGHDAARFVVRAKNSAGKDVTVYVCAGYFKGGTIRVD